MSKLPQLKERSLPPNRSEILAARLAVQQSRGLGITAAQDWCAEQVHTTRRVWQQWEAEEGTASSRRMHPAFWELFQLKTK